jgi:hypothetical protein
MNISNKDAQEALDSIRGTTEKTRHLISSGGAYISLIVTGAIWLLGFLCTQFLSGSVLVYIWIGLSLLGTLIATILNVRISRHIHSPTASATARHMGLLWLLLAVYCIAAIAIAWPLDGRQLTVFIFLFVMVGYLAMGPVLSYSAVWPGLVIIALTLAGYFLLPGLFYLCMALLGGGGMIFLGCTIHSRW